MDSLSQHNIDKLIAELKSAGLNTADPVAKLMVATLAYQAQKIKDEIAALPQRVAERLCEAFVPKNKIDAVPALALVQPSAKTKRENAPHTIADGSFFTFKADARQNFSYYPLFRTLILPFAKSHLLTPTGLRAGNAFSRIEYGKKGQVWLGLEISCEIDSLQFASFDIKGTGGLLPKRIVAGNSSYELNFAAAERMDCIPMMEPFDSQQMNQKNLPVAAHWQNILSNSETDALLYITDSIRDRDLFKQMAFPKAFQQLLESTELDKFADNMLWLMFDFGEEYAVPENIDIIPNALPAVNVNVNSTTLTQSSPISKLTKNDGSFFLSVVETPLSMQKQGFGLNEEEFVIRDFDANSYNPDNLLRDARNLYNHFIEDYYAFVEYNGLKDGELVKGLRETVNRIGKSALAGTDAPNKFDNGVYAMRNVKLIGHSSPIKVTYMTTMGRKGNAPLEGLVMENRKDAALEKEVAVIMSATGGEDRASADQMHELLRYYTLTADRLYTKMDVDAFLRLQLIREFGQEETRRISYAISIQGTEGSLKLRRGLYVDISFKDNKNFQKAASMALDRKLARQIADRSCISMPIIISLSKTED